jgi:hypothetical protein
MVLNGIIDFGHVQLLIIALILHCQAARYCAQKEVSVQLHLLITPFAGLELIAPSQAQQANLTAPYAPHLSTLQLAPPFAVLMAAGAPLQHAIHVKLLAHTSFIMPAAPPCSYHVQHVLRANTL